MILISPKYIWVCFFYTCFFNVPIPVLMYLDQNRIAQQGSWRQHVACIWYICKCVQHRPWFNWKQIKKVLLLIRWHWLLGNYFIALCTAEKWLKYFMQGRTHSKCFNFKIISNDPAMIIQLLIIGLHNQKILDATCGLHMVYVCNIDLGLI